LIDTNGMSALVCPDETTFGSRNHKKALAAWVPELSIVFARGPNLNGRASCGINLICAKELP